MSEDQNRPPQAWDPQQDQGAGALPQDVPGVTSQVPAAATMTQPVSTSQHPETLQDPAQAQRAAHMRRQPPSHFGWALFASLMCLPMGLISMYFSGQVSQRWMMGDVRAAKKASSTSLNITLASIVVGVLVWGGVGLFALDTYWRMNQKPVQSGQGTSGSAGLFDGFSSGILGDLQDSIVERAEDLLGEDVGDLVDENLPSDIPTDLDELQEELPDQLPEEIPEVIDEVSEGTVGDVTDEIVDQVPDSVTDQIPDEVTGQIPDELLNPLGN